MRPVMQSWISEEEVTTWLSKYDWDKSGDISFAEFAALVSCVFATTYTGCAAGSMHLRKILPNLFLILPRGLSATPGEGRCALGRQAGGVRGCLAGSRGGGHQHSSSGGPLQKAWAAPRCVQVTFRHELMALLSHEAVNRAAMHAAGFQLQLNGHCTGEPCTPYRRSTSEDGLDCYRLPHDRP